jgi:hypothetical protein
VVAIVAQVAIRRVAPTAAGSPALSICSSLHLYSYANPTKSVAIKVGRLPQAVLHYLLVILDVILDATLTDFITKTI